MMLHVDGMPVGAIRSHHLMLGEAKVSATGRPRVRATGLVAQMSWGCMPALQTAKDAGERVLVEIVDRSDRRVVKLTDVRWNSFLEAAEATLLF